MDADQMSADEITAAVIALLQNAPHHNWELPAEQEAQDFRAQQLAFHAACEELCKRIRATEGTAAFDALFWLACLRYEPPELPLDLAGYILFYVKPRCSMSCAEAVRALALSQWNVSLEEIPWYLAAHFGPEAVSTAIGSVENEACFVEMKRQREQWQHEIQRRHGERAWRVPHSGDASVRLGTIRYWLKAYARNIHDKSYKWTPFWKRH